MACCEWKRPGSGSATCRSEARFSCWREKRPRPDFRPTRPSLFVVFFVLIVVVIVVVFLGGFLVVFFVVLIFIVVFVAVEFERREARDAKTAAAGVAAPRIANFHFVQVVRVNL